MTIFTKFPKFKLRQLYGSPNELQVFSLLLNEANFADTFVASKNITVPEGAMLISQYDIAHRTGLSRSQVRSAVSNLIKNGFISLTVNGNYSVFSTTPAFSNGEEMPASFNSSGKENNNKKKGMTNDYRSFATSLSGYKCPVE